VGSPPRLAVPPFGRDVPDANPNLAQLRRVQRALCVIALQVPHTGFFRRGDRSCVSPTIWRLLLKMHKARAGFTGDCFVLQSSPDQAALLGRRLSDARQQCPTETVRPLPAEVEL
jgi:hypothetical protein